MNAFDRSRLKSTCWCEDCNLVFDLVLLARQHATEKNHKIKVTEFLVTGKL
jgi:hypothetical protein